MLFCSRVDCNSAEVHADWRLFGEAKCMVLHCNSSFLWVTFCNLQLLFFSKVQFSVLTYDIYFVLLMNDVKVR